LKLGNIKIKPKLIVMFLFAGVIPLIVFGCWSIHKALDTRMQNSFNQLEMIQSFKKIQIEELFKKYKQDIEFLSKSVDINKVVKNLLKYHRYFRIQGDAPYIISTPEYKQIWTDKSGGLCDYLNKYGYYDILIMCKKHGHVMYTAAEKDDLGTNLRYGPYKDSSLSKLWSKVVETREFVFQDFAPYAPSNYEPVAFLGYPIMDDDDNVISVLALELSFDTINEIMQQRDGISDIVDTYLVGADKLMRSNSFIDQEHSVNASFEGNVSKNGIDTIASRNALAGKTGVEIINNYKGNRSLCTYTPLQIENVTWALITEMDEADVKKPIRDMIYCILIIGLFVIVYAVVSAFIIASNIIKPLIMIVGFIQAISKGNLTKKMDITRKDEIGILVNVLNKMRDNIQMVFKNISDNLETLSSTMLEPLAVSKKISPKLKSSTIQTDIAVNKPINDNFSISPAYKKKLDNIQETVIKDASPDEILIDETATVVYL